MPIKLGDFFASAPTARPINPKPVTFTCSAKGPVLPGGTANPGGRAVGATVTGALVFLGGDGAEESRIYARRALRELYVDEEKRPLETDEEDLQIETAYQEVWRFLYEWNADEKKVGERLFDTVDLLRKMVQPTEIGRLKAAYRAYVDDQHPEVVPDKPFQDATGGGAPVAAKKSR
jgi:hypothetical protein